MSDSEHILYAYWLALLSVGSGCWSAPPYFYVIIDCIFVVNLSDCFVLCNLGLVCLVSHEVW